MGQYFGKQTGLGFLPRDFCSVVATVLGLNSVPVWLLSLFASGEGQMPCKANKVALQSQVVTSTARVALFMSYCLVQERKGLLEF